MDSLRCRENTDNSPPFWRTKSKDEFSRGGEPLDDLDQFILGRHLVRNFDMMIDLDNELMRIENPDRKYVKRPVNRRITDQNKIPIFLDRKVKL